MPSEGELPFSPGRDREREGVGFAKEVVCFCLVKSTFVSDYPLRTRGALYVHVPAFGDVRGLSGPRFVNIPH